MRKINVTLKRAAAAAALAAALAATVPALAGGMNSQDQTFVKMAAQGGMAEVADAKVVDAKTTDPAVKAFAERMIRETAKPILNWLPS